MALQIKGKFISNEAVDGSKLKLKQGEAIRATDENGLDIELLKIGPNGEILANGDELALDADLETEKSRAQAAEAALSAAVSAEATARAAAVSAEASARQAADAVLQANVDAEASARAAAVASEAAARAAAIASEAAARTSADSALQANIDSEASARAAAVSSEASARQSADAALSGRLDVVEGAGEGSVAKAEADAKAYADQKISDLIDGAPGLLDTLNELAAAIGDDANFASSIASSVAAVQSNVDAEVAARAAAVSAEASARASAVSAVQAELDAEESRAMSAEAALSAAVSAEAAARAAAVSAEASARQAADAALQAEIDAEESARASAVSGLQSSLSSEVSRAQAAEASLQSAVTALQGAVGQDLSEAIDDLEAAIAAEALSRGNADSALQASLSSETSARQAADTTLQNNISSEVTRAQTAEAGLQSSLSTEISDRQAAVSAEAATRSANDAALQAAVDAEVAARGVAVSGEASARQAADAALSASLASESAARVAGDASTLSSAQSYADQKIADLVNSAPAILDTLKELSDAIGGDANFAATIAGQIGDVQDNVDAEEARALAAEGVLQANIASESAARAAAVAAERSRAEAAEALKVNKAGDTITGEMIFQNADLRVKNPSGQTVALFDASESSAVFGYASPDNLTTEMVGGAIKVEAGANLGGAQTFIGAGFINLQESNGAVAMPTLAKHVAPKGYVDQEMSVEAAARSSVDTAHNSRISALEAKAFYKKAVQLSAQDVSNGYIMLDHAAVSKSTSVAVGRLMIHEGASLDYTVTTVGGVSRITFLNSLVSPGQESLASGDWIFVQYQA